MAGNDDQQDILNRKRSMTLDLDTGGSRSRKLRSQFGNSPPVLTSPDLRSFALASPEVEQFIKTGIPMNSTSTQPTPVSVYLCPKNVTDRQVQFAKGFEEALAKVQQRNTGRIEQVPGQTNNTAPPPTTTIVPSTTATITSNLTVANLHNLNIEMGTVSNSSDGICSDDTSDSMSLMRDEQTVPLNGINMKDQEVMKLERKRLRNRIAASKCRKKKIERITQLEDQVNRLKSENQEYEKMIMVLRNEISSLQSEASIHRQHGCLIEM